LGTKHWSGYLQIQCKDLFTLVKTVKASFFIPGKSVDEKAVLERIAMLNSNLRASSWRIIHVSKHTEKGRFFIVAVDETSAGLIRDRNSAVFYGLGQIQINLKPQGQEKL
jgi:Domain of unknown function (DUF4780)